MNIFVFFQKRHWPKWTVDAFAFLGIVVFVVQSMVYAHTTISSLDEGGYLYKGLLFARGIYRPFQPYGVWTNKMPLVFLIPGYAQFLFGTGLRTGRYLAVFEGILTLAALWMVSRRMSGKLLAAGAVWVLALSPAVIKYYSNGVSQALTACLLAWSLALALGEDRKLWQLILSSAITGLMILTRQNMIVALPLLIGYILWQHGWKKAAWAAAAGLGVFVIGHWIYWPDILQIWASWIPKKYFPELRSFIPSGGGTAFWHPSINLSGRLISTFQALRVHFVPLAGSIISIFFWPKREKWKNEASFRAALFLALLFFLSLLMHSWASLNKDYCVYCFTPYVAFFNVAGLLMVVVSLPSWKNSLPTILQGVLVILILAFCTGMGYSLFDEVGNWLINLPAPRLRAGLILRGFTTVYEILSNKYGIASSPARKYASAAAGFVIGFLIMLFVYTVSRIRKWKIDRLPATVFLILGVLFSPLLAGNLGSFDCRSDVIRMNEQVGADLAKNIEPGSLAYWNGGLSVAPLLYAPEVRIYPPQINAGYAYKYGGDSDELLRYGLWNDDLAYRWMNEADYIIIEESRYLDWKPFLSPNRFEELPRTKVGTSCKENTRLRIFKRIP
jgi:hypothetical protein